MLSTPDYRALKTEDIPAAGALLGRAFRDSPSYGAILAHLTSEQRAAAIVRVKTGFTAAAVRHQTTDSAWIDGRPAAVALMTTPGQWPPPLPVSLWHARGCIPVGPRAIPNFMRADHYLTSRHPREPHHYLFVLGVEPEFQGRGLGKQLLARMSARADAEGLPCYLETDKERNVRLYESAGYCVISDETVPTRPGFRMWTMTRPSRAGGNGNETQSIAHGSTCR